MVIQYKPLSNEEVAEIERSKYKCIEDGDYPSVVDSCEQKTSKSGNEMFELVVSMKDKNNRIVTLKDWLLPGNEKTYYKFKHFCESAGKPEYLNGTVHDVDIKGQHVISRVYNRLEKRITDTGEQKEFYKSMIVDYILLAKFEPSGLSYKVMEDDIPF